MMCKLIDSNEWNIHTCILYSGIQVLTNAYVNNVWLNWIKPIIVASITSKKGLKSFDCDLIRICTCDDGVIILPIYWISVLVFPLDIWSRVTVCSACHGHFLVEGHLYRSCFKLCCYDSSRCCFILWCYTTKCCFKLRCYGSSRCCICFEILKYSYHLFFLIFSR